MCVAQSFQSRKGVLTMAEVKWLSPGEAAAILGVTTRRVHQLLDSGELASEQIGGRALLDVEASGGITKRTRLISGCRCEQENSRHIPMSCDLQT